MHYSPIYFVFLQTNIKKTKDNETKNHDDFHEIKPQNSEIHRSFTDVYLLSHCTEHDGAARKIFQFRQPAFEQPCHSGVPGFKWFHLDCHP